MNTARESAWGKWFGFHWWPFQRSNKAPVEAKPAVRPPVVTITANPHFPAVNFFLDEEGAGTVQIEPGTQCTYLDGPIEVEIVGVTMRFYKLEHDGVTGYVNVRCVDASGVGRVEG